MARNSGLYYDSQILNTYAMCFNYRKHWSWEFSKKEIEEIHMKALEVVKPEDVEEGVKWLKETKFDNEVEANLACGYLLVREQLLRMWGADSDIREEIQVEIDKIKDKYKESLNLENLKTVSVEMLGDIGFKPWDDNIYLIPLWAVNLLPDNIELESIDETKETLGECDKDVRFGCIAFGFRLKG